MEFSLGLAPRSAIAPPAHSNRLVNGDAPESGLPIPSMPSFTSPPLQLQELFTVAGRTAAIGRVKPALGACFLSFRQRGIPCGANSAMSKVRIIGCLAFGTSPLLLDFGHRTTPSSLDVHLSHTKTITNQHRKGPNDGQWVPRSGTAPLPRTMHQFVCSASKPHLHVGFGPKTSGTTPELSKPYDSLIEDASDRSLGALPMDYRLLCYTESTGNLVAPPYRF